jgi:hypothetical protein
LEFLQFNVIFTENPFRSNTLLEAVLPSLEALLEVFCEVLQYISYSSLDVADYLKISSWVVLDCQEEESHMGTDMGNAVAAEPLQCSWISKNSLTDNTP